MQTVSIWNEAAYTEDDFFGVTMYWSNYGLEEYEEMLEGLGFNMRAITVVGHGYGQTHQTSDERHPLVFAQKKEHLTRFATSRLPRYEEIDDGRDYDFP
jgi:hypothetical protein